MGGLFIKIWERFTPLPQYLPSQSQTLLHSPLLKIYACVTPILCNEQTSAARSNILIHISTNPHPPSLPGRGYQNQNRLGSSPRPEFSCAAQSQPRTPAACLKQNSLHTLPHFFPTPT